MSKLTSLLERTLTEHREEFIHDTKVWHSTEAFRRDVGEVITLFREAGFERGDTIVLAYPNSYAFTVIYFASLRYGLTLAPIHPQMPAPELRTFLENSQAVGGFFLPEHSSVIQCLIEAASSTVALHTAFISPCDEEIVPKTGFCRTKSGFIEREFTATQEDRTPSWPEEPSEESVGILLFTSGTTGRPKAVGLKHRHLMATCENVIAAHRLSASDVSYCFLPLFHINAQVVALLSTWLSGGKVVVAPKFSASGFWPTVEAHGVTWVSAVPTIIAILLNRKLPEKIPDSLRFVRSASAQLPVLHARKFERLTGIPIIESYGMTEAASQICVNPLPPTEHRLGSVGLPQGVELKVVDSENQPLPHHSVGEIVIRGRSVIEAYVQAENQNDFQQGWFHTGDLGYVDEDGFVYLTGRKKEMINRAGEKISPYEVEDAIREHELVDKVAVIGLPDTLYGEKIVAYVTSKSLIINESEFANELKEHCRMRLSHFKCPSDVHIASNIPVGPTGKIQRTRLKMSILEAATL